MYAGGKLVVHGKGPCHVLKTVGDGWKERRTQDSDLEVRVASDASYSCKCFLDIGLGCLKLSDATIIGV